VPGLAPGALGPHWTRGSYGAPETYAGSGRYSPFGDAGADPAY
jgi:hypothetical protein